MKKQKIRSKVRVVRVKDSTGILNLDMVATVSVTSSYICTKRGLTRTLDDTL